MLDRSNVEINNPIYLRDYDEDEQSTNDGDAFTFNSADKVNYILGNN